MEPIIRGSHPSGDRRQGSGVEPPTVIGNTSATDAGEERPVYLLDSVRSSEFLYFPIYLISHSTVYPGLNFFLLSTFYSFPFSSTCVKFFDFQHSQQKFPNGDAVDHSWRTQARNVFCWWKFLSHQKTWDLRNWNKGKDCIWRKRRSAVLTWIMTVSLIVILLNIFVTTGRTLFKCFKLVLDLLL